MLSFQLMINIYCIIKFIWSNTVIHYKHKYYSRCVVSATFLCNAFVAFGMQFSQDLNNVLKVCSEHLLVSTKTLMKGFTCILMRSPSRSLANSFLSSLAYLLSLYLRQLCSGIFSRSWRCNCTGTASDTLLNIQYLIRRSSNGRN